MDIRDGSAETGSLGTQAMSKRRRMTVSTALKWAWNDELPKEQSAVAAPDLSTRSAWAAIAAWGELHSIVDRQPNRWGCVPFDDVGFPHPDAIRIAEAVMSLADCSVDVPEGWHPMPELATVDEALARVAVGDAVRRATVLVGADLHFRARPDAIIVRHAILGLVPDWRMDSLPAIEFERWDNGRHRWFVEREVRSVVGQNGDGSQKVAVETVEVDGWSTRLQRPVAGAYRKALFNPDPVPIMVARAEYEIFCAAMCMLHDDLDGCLESIDLVATDYPVQPWGDLPEEGDLPRGSKILPDLRQRTRPQGAQKSPAISEAKANRRRSEKSA